MSDMRPGNHAAADGSFQRSAGAAMGRGVLLLVVAFVLGIVLLNATDEQPPGTDLVAGDRASTDAPPDDEGDDDATVSTSTTQPVATTVPVRAPAEVKVIVANASDVSGAAGGATTRLKAAQYNALAPGNSAKVATSAVYFTAGYQAEAAAIAAALELPANVVAAIPTPPPLDPKTANVVVVLGADAAPRFGTGAASATTTTAGGGAGSTTSTSTTTR